MSSSLRLVFFGTPDFAVPSLHALIDGHDPVVAVVCQPDKPAGRGQRVVAPPVKELALRRGIPVLQPEKIRAPEFLDALRTCAPDLIVVAAYGKILPPVVLDLPRHGCLNVHGSLLPKYRGAAPIQWAILEGEERTGITIMRMNERMDAGDIVLQADVDIAPGETAGALQGRLAEIGAAVLMRAIDQVRAGTVRARAQEEAGVTFAPLIKKEHGRIDWTRPACVIERMVRAFNPWPSAFTTCHGKLLKIHRAHLGALSPAAAPGTVTAAGAEVTVATGDGTLVLDEVQFEGRKRLPASAVVRGGGMSVGMVLQ